MALDLSHRKFTLFFHYLSFGSIPWNKTSFFHFFPNFALVLNFSRTSQLIPKSLDLILVAITANFQPQQQLSLPQGFIVNDVCHKSCIEGCQSSLRQATI